MNGFERKKIQSRENILKATEALWLKYGLNKISVNDIAHRAGVSQVTIYNLFGSKDKLIYDCIEIYANKFFERFRELLKSDKPFIEKLEGIFNFGLEMYDSHLEPSNVEYLNNPQLRQLRDSVLERERQVFFEFIKEGQEQGYLNPDLSDESIAIYLEVISKSITSDPELYAKVHGNDKQFQDFLAIMLHGFAKVS